MKTEQDIDYSKLFMKDKDYIVYSFIKENPQYFKDIRKVEFTRHFSQIYTKSNTMTSTLSPSGAYKRVLRSKALTVGIFHGWGMDH